MLLWSMILCVKWELKTALSSNKREVECPLSPAIFILLKLIFKYVTIPSLIVKRTICVVVTNPSPDINKPSMLFI